MQDRAPPAKLDSHRLNDACELLIAMSRRQENAGNPHMALSLAALHDEIGGVADRLSFHEARDAENFKRGPMMRERDNVSLIAHRIAAQRRCRVWPVARRVILGSLGFAAVVLLILIVPELLS
jgi:hypothetical protein